MDSYVAISRPPRNDVLRDGASLAGGSSKEPHHSPAQITRIGITRLRVECPQLPRRARVRLFPDPPYREVRESRLGACLLPESLLETNMCAARPDY